MAKGYYWTSERDGFDGTTYSRRYHLMQRVNEYDNILVGTVIWKRIWGVYKADINGQVRNFNSLSGAKRFVESVAGVKLKTRKQTNEFGLDWNLK